MIGSAISITTLPSTTIIIMPAQRSSLLQSLSSASEATRRQQYEANVNRSRVRFNRTGRAYSRGSSYIPYPLLEDVYNRSNHAVTEDDDFADLGLNDFVSAQRRIAHHQLNRRRERLTVREHGLLGRPLEEWDEAEGSDEASGVIETCMSYSAAVGIQGLERDIIMQDDVSLVFFLDRVLDLCLFIDRGVVQPDVG